MEANDFVVATGQLFKQGHLVKYWKLRQFNLLAFELTYHDETGAKKGSFDTRNCSVHEIDLKDANAPFQGQYAFALESPGKSLLLCASNEESRREWIQNIKEEGQRLQKPQDFIHPDEITHCDTVVVESSLMGLSNKRVRIILTNYPRLVFVDPGTELVIGQLSWDSENPPAITKVSYLIYKL